jgi:hypothetical protein
MTVIGALDQLERLAVAERAEAEHCQQSEQGVAGLIHGLHSRGRTFSNSPATPPD